MLGVAVAPAPFCSGRRQDWSGTSSRQSRAGSTWCHGHSVPGPCTVHRNASIGGIQPWVTPPGRGEHGEDLILPRFVLQEPR